MDGKLCPGIPPFEIFSPLSQGKPPPPFNPEIFQTPLFEILA